jgi:hypothetical protein
MREISRVRRPEVEYSYLLMQSLFILARQGKSCAKSLVKILYPFLRHDEAHSNSVGYARPIAGPACHPVAFGLHPSLSGDTIYIDGCYDPCAWLREP